MTDSYAETAPAGGHELTRGSGYELPEYPFHEPPELASGQPSHHEIVIVGGGITGLTLACALAQ
jgi:3-(3-hydroxy-phenyl)propionate hydroxylase